MELQATNVGGLEDWDTALAELGVDQLFDDLEVPSPPREEASELPAPLPIGCSTQSLAAAASSSQASSARLCVLGSVALSMCQGCYRGTVAVARLHLHHTKRPDRGWELCSLRQWDDSRIQVCFDDGRLVRHFLGLSCRALTSRNTSLV